MSEKIKCKECGIEYHKGAAHYHSIEFYKDKISVLEAERNDMKEEAIEWRSILRDERDESLKQLAQNKKLREIVEKAREFCNFFELPPTSMGMPSYSPSLFKELEKALKEME